VPQGELSSSLIRDLLSALDRELQRRGCEAKLFIVGGAAMALAYNASRVTDDIDGIFVPRDVVLAAAREVAAERGLDEHWLSDGVRQMMPPVDDDHPRSERIGPALTLEVASPEYLLAMKAMSSRQSQGDLQDAGLLCAQLRITREDQLEQIVDRYFGGSRRYGAQELFFERIIEAAESI
jgi:Nucleotidyltransferase of unknown function (DUF6036)